MIALVDYGAGNLTSVRKALTAVGADFFTPAAPEELGGTTGVIVPGVGHFESTRAMTGPWRAAILASVARRAHLLGICLGLQYLFEGSDEAPELSGLGLFAGRCTRLPPKVKVPHVGWNALSTRRRSLLLQGISDATQVYFTHSYAAPITRVAAATTEHGARFASVVEKDLVFGVQFHPEKSGETGLRVLRSFVDICRFPHSQISKFPNS